MTNVLPIKIEADHFGICKPPSTDDDVYLGVSQFLEEILLQDSSVDRSQEPFQILSPNQYRDLLRTELTNRLKTPQLSGPGEILCRNLGVTDLTEAVNILIPGKPPLQSVHEWTRVVRGYLQDPTVDYSARRSVWPFLEQVHLDLLKTLIGCEKVLEAIRNDDKLLLVLAVEHDGPNRPIEVLVARLDGNRKVEFTREKSDKAAALARPLYQMDAGSDEFSEASIPQSRFAVEFVGRRLLAAFGEEVPDRMEDRHWKRLNAALGASRYGDRPYYFVIPDSHPIYAQATVRAELRRYLPNLPRILIDEKAGTTPFGCDPVELDEAIKAFYRMMPVQDSNDEN